VASARLRPEFTVSIGFLASFLPAFGHAGGDKALPPGMGRISQMTARGLSRSKIGKGKLGHFGCVSLGHLSRQNPFQF